MSASGNRGVPDAELRALCSWVWRALEAHRLDVALAIAWLTLCKKNGDRFKQLAKFALASGHVTDAEQFEAMRLLDWREDDDPAERLFELARPCPVALVRFLDHQLAYGTLASAAEEAHAGPVEGVFAGGVCATELDSDCLAALGLPSEFARVFVVRRRRSALRPPAAERQLPNLNRFNANWNVVPEVPDLNHPHRKVSFDGPTHGLRNACQAIAGRSERILRVYLGEFECRPDFDARLSQGAERVSWRAVGLRNADAVAEEALRHLERAKSLRADVVVLPELTIPPPIRGAIQDWMGDTGRGGEGEAGHLIGWVIAGSFHDEEGIEPDVTVFNTAFAVDRTGDSIPHFAHRKITSVSLDGDRLLEGNMAGAQIGLVQTPLGIQAVLICLDLAQSIETDKLPIEQLPINFLWVPSLSRKVSAHMRRADGINLHHLTHVACSNQGDAQCTSDLALGGDPRQSFLVGPADRAGSPAQPCSSGDSWMLYELAL